MDRSEAQQDKPYIVDQATKAEARILKETVFGRSGNDHNYPDDAKISRKHFKLIPTAEGGVLIEDLGATNHTKLNGVNLPPLNPQKLRSGDLIEFGKQKLRVFIPADEKSLVFKSPGASRTGEIQLSSDALFEKAREAKAKSAHVKDEGILRALVGRKNGSWYVQHDGSEHGPFLLAELREQLAGKRFQGGELLLFTEGLAEWMPIARLRPLIDEPEPQLSGIQRMGQK
jgi:predicted component of type VI protein secretion system